MNHQDYLDVAEATDGKVFEGALRRFADKLGFPLVSGALVIERPAGPATYIPFGNFPDGYAAIFADPSNSQRCPVIRRMKASSRAFTYDRALYHRDGVDDLWESQAPFGYQTGVAMASHFGQGRHFLLGLDRDEPLPNEDTQLMRLMGDLQLLGAYAQEAAVRVLTPKQGGPEEIPILTDRQLEILRWTRDGKSAAVVGTLLGLSEKTINYHLRNVEAKMGVAGKHQAVVKALSFGLL